MRVNGIRQAFVFGAVALAMIVTATPAKALDLDWAGQFRAEAHMVNNYSLSDTNVQRDLTRVNQDGYYVPGGGSTTAHFQTLFMRLRPKVIVNDNVYIKSELWFGNPVYGFFGDAVPGTTDQRQFYSNQSAGSIVRAQRFWGEFLSDIGTVQVGRAPLNWGLGIVWNNGDGLWDRYQSTGDVIRLVSKFGAFSFVPSIVKYSAGNNISGAIDPTTLTTSSSTTSGGGGMSDYSLAFKYENPDEDFEGGVNFIRRIAGASNDRYFGITQVPAGLTYNIWDIFGRKKFGKFSLAAEAPITSGSVGGVEYSTWGVAAEAEYKFSETWESTIHFGHAPGQPNVVGTGTPSKFRAFFFNPNYNLGLIMFNYQLAGFAGPNTTNNPATTQAQLKSPFDNPIVNANYLAWTGMLNADKWSFHTSFVYAKALETAKPGETFYNTVSRTLVNGNAAAAPQSDSLGWEIDLGTTFHWDETFQFKFDLGLYSPGDFFKFSNGAVQNEVSSVKAMVIGVGANF